MTTKKLQLDSAAFNNRGAEFKQTSVFHQIGQDQTANGTGLFLVCNGVGGRRTRDIASQIAIDQISNELMPARFLTQPSPGARSKHRATDTGDALLERAIQQAHTEICRYAQKNLQSSERMGATVTAAFIADHTIKIANVGDGRAYVWRDGVLTQITTDHTLAVRLAEKGLIDIKDIPYHPHNNIVLRALGTADDVKIDIFGWQSQPGDKLLLCSNGLWKAFGSDEKLSRWLQQDISAANLCRQLESYTNIRDGATNVQAVVTSIGDRFERRIEA